MRTIAPDLDAELSDTDIEMIVGDIAGFIYEQFGLDPD